MCTRALYVGADDLVITGRSMDWAEDMHSNIWVLPRGLARNGAAGANAVTWTSRFGSVVVSAYDVGSADGMNEAGLVMNGLYLAESDYDSPDGRPTMSIMAYGQYVLDQFATVAEAVGALSDDAIGVIAPMLPNGRATTVHMSLSDPTGDSAIFEFVAGKLTIHHSRDYQVMTNSPTFDQQLAIASYWAGVDPLAFLPGTINAADRFARMSFYLRAIPKQIDPRTISAVPGETYSRQAVAAVMSAMRSISTPLGVSHPDRPNLASTLWRTVWDQRNLLLFFDSATTPNTFWLPFAELEFGAGAPVRKLTVAGGAIYAGNAASQLVAAEPFRFLAANPGTSAA